MKRKSPYQNLGSRKKAMLPYRAFVAPRKVPRTYLRTQPGRYRRRGFKAEVKTVDSSMSSMQLSNNSAVANSMLLLNTVPQDASPTGRIGKKIIVVGVAVRGIVQAASASTIEKSTILLIWIKTPNQASTLPAWNEILSAQSSLSVTNRDNASKFKILRRWDFPMAGNSTTPGTGQEVHVFEDYVSLKGLKSVWTNAGTAGTIGQFEKGALILGTVGVGAYGATTTPILSGNTRFYFKDD